MKTMANSTMFGMCESGSVHTGIDEVHSFFCVFVLDMDPTTGDNQNLLKLSL